MTDLEKIRAFAKQLVDEADTATIERGVAGAAPERARGTAARDLLALLDSLPALTSPMTDTDVHELRKLRAALGGELATAAGRSLWAQELRGIDALSKVIDHVAVAAIPATSPDRIPPAIRASLDRYASTGIRTGGCLHAILSNDLIVAFAAADPETLEALPAIVAYVTTQLPATCFGSHEIVERWIARPRS